MAVFDCHCEESRQRRDDAAISEDLTAEKGKVLDRINRINRILWDLERELYSVNRINPVLKMRVFGYR